MSTLAAFIVAISGAIAGSLIGVTIGFCLASHNDVLRGTRPNTKSRLIRFLARPTKEFGFLESIAFIVLILVWLAAFFGLCGLPAIVAQQLGVESSAVVQLAYILLAGFGWLGRRFGAHAWKVMS